MSEKLKQRHMQFAGMQEFGLVKGNLVYQIGDFDSLPLVTKKNLEPELIRVASEAFRRPRSPEFDADVSLHIRGGDLLVLTKNGIPEGFALLQRFPELQAVYVAGIVNAHAGSHAIEEALKMYLSKVDEDKVVIRTQNDRVVEIMKALCTNLASLDRPFNPDEIKILEKMELIKDNVEITPNIVIVKGHYGGAMIGAERRRSSDSEVCNLTDRLNYEQGDALLLLGYKSM